jgi:hypothetical protein
MKQWLAAALIAIFTAGIVSAQEAPPLSEKQFRKLIKFVDQIGAKQEFPAPTAQDLGFSSDTTLVLPVLLVVTDDHQVYFARSQRNRDDYIVWVRAEGNTASYMFSTHADLKLIRALYLKESQFPQSLDTSSPRVKKIYRDALADLGKDVDKSPPR